MAKVSTKASRAPRMNRVLGREPSYIIAPARRRISFLIRHPRPGRLVLETPRHRARLPPAAPSDQQRRGRHRGRVRQPPVQPLQLHIDGVPEHTFEPPAATGRSSTGLAASRTSDPRVSPAPECSLSPSTRHDQPSRASRSRPRSALRGRNQRRALGQAGDGAAMLVRPLSYRITAPGASVRPASRGAAASARRIVVSDSARELKPTTRMGSAVGHAKPFLDRHVEAAKMFSMAETSAMPRRIPITDPASAPAVRGSGAGYNHPCRAGRPGFSSLRPGRCVNNRRRGRAHRTRPGPGRDPAQHEHPRPRPPGSAPTPDHEGGRVTGRTRRGI